MGKPAPFLPLISARPYLVQAQSGPPARQIPERAISDSPPDKDRKISVDAFQSALKQGFKLDVPKVQENVSTYAATMPCRICKRVFGDEVAKNCAAIEVTIPNRSLRAKSSLD